MRDGDCDETPRREDGFMMCENEIEGGDTGDPYPFQRAALIVNTRAPGRAEYHPGALPPDSGRRPDRGRAHPARRGAAGRDGPRGPRWGCDLIVLGGGDGSVSAIVEQMAHRQATLGLLPLGAANGVARTPGIPRDLDAACATIARGAVARVDLGLAGDDHYVNVVSVGLGAEVITAVSPTLKRLAGALAYPVAAARALLRYRPFAATLSFPDGDHPTTTFPRLLHVAIGNGRFYGGGMTADFTGVA